MGRRAQRRQAVEQGRIGESQFSDSKFEESKEGRFRQPLNEGCRLALSLRRE